MPGRPSQYNYFRTYDPATGRYLEADPIGQAGGHNLYAYVASDPLNAIDPAGLTEEAIRYIWRQALQEFGDVNPIGIPVCGSVSSESSASTSWRSGNITVPKELCERPCLTREQWEDLFFTLFHESMHSSDPVARRFYDAVNNSFGRVTAHHQTIHNREVFERLRPPALPDPMWGTPRAEPLTGKDKQSLYEEYRKHTPECCEEHE